MTPNLIVALPTVRLELESRPESVTLVRSVVAGLGEFLDLDAELLDDLRTAISEACNNVVLHAYGDGQPGPLIMSLEITDNGVEVVVRDCGGGIQRVSATDERMGVGLAVISALADRAEFETHPEGGTAVRMSFGRGRLKLPEPARASVSGPPAPQLSGDIVARISPVGLLGEALGRLVRAVAAGSHFSLDRFSDLYPMADEIAAHAVRNAPGPEISFAIVGRPRWIELTVGPFTPGSGVALDDRGTNGDVSMLKRLVDELSMTSRDGYELLTATIVDKRPETAGRR